ncbi:MAG: hypothetical protein GC134_01760 [Proteobacteria bacterium]|nr:hypothetical protein [Pseudomonadota bacterium]
MNKTVAGNVSRYLKTSLLVLFGLAVVYVACINLYVRYAPYELPKPTGVVPDLSAFKPDEASPIPLVEQQQIWVAEQYLYDHEGKYQNPQLGLEIFVKLAQSDSPATAERGQDAVIQAGAMCTEQIAGIYQLKSWFLWRKAKVLPITDAGMRVLYSCWEKLKQRDHVKADRALALLVASNCVRKSPLFEDTFGKEVLQPSNR